MTSSATPLLDKRNAADVASQIQQLLGQYVPSWKDIDPQTGQPSGVTAALIGVFARYSEIIIQRLNQAPDKNFLAFLNLLGLSRLPPQPARVPLTFSLTPGTTSSVVVPAGTQVAAQLAEGETDPVLFETENELVATPAQLNAVYVREPGQDEYANVTSVLSTIDWQGQPLLQGSQAIEHTFSFRDDRIFSYPAIQSLSLTFNLDTIPAPVDGRAVTWEVWDGNQALPMPLPASSDGTANLSQSGTINFQDMTNFLLLATDKRQLRCRLMTPITPLSSPQANMVRGTQLPKVNQLNIQAAINRSSLSPDKAFTNLLPLDLSKDHFPFGEKPRFGDAVYLADSEVFSQTNAVITITINLTDEKSGVPHPNVNGIPALTWEFWNGASWVGLGISSVRTNGQPVGASKFTDTTRSLTQDGVVTFVLTQKPVMVTINGIQSYWVRARLSGGNYGKEAYYAPVDPNDLTKGYAFFQATFQPPSILQIALGYITSPSVTIHQAATYNDFVSQTQSFPCAPFQMTQDTAPTFYLGFTLPTGVMSFPNRKISLYLQVTDIIYGTSPDNPTALDPARLSWEYSTGQGWSPLTVIDGSSAFTKTGPVEFIAPEDFLPQAEFAQVDYWLRAVWDAGDYLYNPKISFISINTTTALQTITHRNEILGSGDGSKNLQFTTARTPVLNGQALVAREPELPSADEQAVIVQDEGGDAISITYDTSGRPLEIWVRWHEVADFYGSRPRDRHYVLNHLTGVISFGDGLTGMIPPSGAGNVRLAAYKTGGGEKGNKPAGVITQLKTTIPYIAKVANLSPASGGADAQALQNLLDIAPHTIRHRNRAVTIEDFVDLALLATPEVARARCVPLHNLVTDPDAKSIKSGEVSVIIVPRSNAPKPKPSLELISRVSTYLDDHRLPCFELWVVGPDYVRVDIQADVALSSIEGAGAVQAAIEQALASFLHPLTGGPSGSGWDFGRTPQLSDLYALIESIPGVDHVRTLVINEVEERPDASQTANFLVYSGNHQVSVRFGEV